MADLIWLFANIPNDISPAAYTDCLRLIPLTHKSGLKTILMPSIIKGDYQNNRQWAKVSANQFMCNFTEAQQMAEAVNYSLLLLLWSTELQP